METPLTCTEVLVQSEIGNAQLPNYSEDSTLPVCANCQYFGGYYTVSCCTHPKHPCFAAIKPTGTCDSFHQRTQE